MNRQEAEALITKTEGRLCVRFYRRADGSILTRNCPVGLRAIKRRVAWAAQVVLGMVLSFVSGLGLYIFHLGRKPFPLPEIRRLLRPHTEITGVVAPPSKFHPQVREPKIDRIKIEPRQHGGVPQNKAKRQTGDQGISKNE